MSKIQISIEFDDQLEGIADKVTQALAALQAPTRENQPEDEILTPEDLATIWKVPKSKIYNLTMRTGTGCIPRFKIGRDLRFHRSQVMAWAAENGIK